MTGREVYEIWAKEGAKWTDWVRPVPFIAIDDNAQIAVKYPLVKQAYDELGMNKVQALKYHVGNIKRELMKRQPAPTEYKIVKMINTTFQKQTPITKSKVKAELQRIYDDLGIKQTAKANDLNK